MWQWGQQGDSPETTPMVTYISTTLRAKEAMTMPALTSSPPAITTSRWPKRLLRTVDRGAGEGESRGQHPPQQLHSHHLLQGLFSYSCPSPLRCHLPAQHSITPESPSEHGTAHSV